MRARFFLALAVCCFHSPVGISLIVPICVNCTIYAQLKRMQWNNYAEIGENAQRLRDYLRTYLRRKKVYKCDYTKKTRQRKEHNSIRNSNITECRCRGVKSNGIADGKAYSIPSYSSIRTEYNANTIGFEHVFAVCVCDLDCFFLFAVLSFIIGTGKYDVIYRFKMQEKSFLQ